MKQNFELRNEAWNTLSGNWGNSVLIYFLISLVSGIISGTVTVLLPELSSIANFATSIFLTYPLIYVFVVKLMSLVRENKPLALNDFIDTFKVKYSRALPIMGLTFVYIFLWTLLLIIPGIIKSYSYALTVYISEDNPELTPEECINKSMEMMNGNKWKLFLLDLSFIGWLFLSILTLGIALLWFRPYLETARIYFYEDLKSSLETKAIEE